MEKKVREYSESNSLQEAIGLQDFDEELAELYTMLTYDVVKGRYKDGVELIKAIENLNYPLRIYLQCLLKTETIVMAREFIKIYLLKNDTSREEFMETIGISPEEHKVKSNIFNPLVDKDNGGD